MKKVFVSYSWENNCYKKWVKLFCDELEKYNISVVLDQNSLILGDNITEFMENSIADSDYVLILCTPSYKTKSDKRTGGVGYEESIITSDIYYKQNHRKYITLLISGTWESAVPNWAKGKLGVNLTNLDNIAIEFKRLVQTITESNNDITHLRLKNKIIPYDYFFKDFTKPLDKITFYDLEKNEINLFDFYKNDIILEEEMADPLSNSELEKMTVYKSNGESMTIEVIAVLKSPDESKLFMLYTMDSEVEDIDIYASIIHENEEGYVLDKVSDCEDWKLIQKAIIELAN